MTLTDTIPTSDRLFPKLSEYQMQCAVDAGEELHLKDGEVIFREGVGRADFYVILDGKVRVVRRGAGGEDVLLTVHERGDFTGTTDLLSGEAASATGYALGPAQVAHVPAEHFNELILACPELRALLLPAFAERRRAEYAIAAQQQKLAALGKMSAGLAHELNNPAAAAQRAAQTLAASLNSVESLCCDLLNCLLARHSNDGVPLADICELARRESPELDPLAQSEREDELSDWLATMKVEHPWEAAASLVSAGLTRKDLEPLANAPLPLVPKLLTWLAKDIEMRQTCRDLGESTGRITEIVCAMKAYSHMDQSPVPAPTDLNQGILTTGTVLKHKAKKKDLKFEKQFGDVPPVRGIAGELNQVWTNLLDNAIDASPVGGTVRIRTAREGDQAVVEITDQGPGIPPEVRSRIFEPFFTTKPVGQGTGLGLDTSYRIVRSHKGDIRFDSRPGETRFTVRLPLS